MSVAVKKSLATLEDLLAIPEHDRYHEVIGGELVRKPSASFRHGVAHGGVGARIGRQYDRSPGGRRPGGWWLVNGTEIRFEPHEIYRPDVSGWLRTRMPAPTTQWPVELRPDWVCEILSEPPHAGNDKTWKMRVYHRHGVPHYWLLDPVDETLIVHRWTEKGYLIAQTAQGDERIRAEPFDVVNLSVRGLLEGDEDDDEP